MKPLAVDLCAGLGGWTSGLLAEGWDVVGFDIERHVYGDDRYPAQLVLQDILTLDGRQFRGHVSLIAASPPCQFFSYCAMPWSRAKKLAAEVRADPIRLAKELALFNACVRIGKEAECPIVIENVRGAQPWVGRSRWNFGSFHLWGDVPALMPMTKPRAKVGGIDFNDFKNGKGTSPGFNDTAIKNNGGSWFAIGSKGQKELQRNPVSVPGGHRRISEAHRSESPAKGYGAVTEDGIKHGGDCGDGVKHHATGAAWFDGKPDKMLGHFGPAKYGSKSNARKAASAQIAKIPLPLSKWIASVYYPRYESAAIHIRRAAPSLEPHQRGSQR